MVHLVCGSWEGLKSSDAAIGKLEVILADWMFCCCMRRWPLLVASYLARCLVTREVVRPGQDSKCAGVSSAVASTAVSLLVVAVLAVCLGLENRQHEELHLLHHLCLCEVGLPLLGLLVSELAGSCFCG